MSGEDAFTAIAELAAGISVIERENIRPESRLLADLRLDGDDAGELINAYAEHFGVDMTDFLWLRYFNDEGVDIFTPAFVVTFRAISPHFKAKWRAARAQEREITVAHLVDVVGTRRWIHPGTEHARQGPEMPAWLALIVCWPFLLLSAFGVIALFGLATGAIGQISLVTGAGVVLAAAMPVWWGWTTWINIKRKLATA